MVQKHIMVVGRTENLQNIDYLLEVSGCRVTRVGDIREAVDIMLLKKIPFRKLDLILIDNFALLVQFMEVFTGTVRLRERYPVIVFDKLNLRESFRQMFSPAMDDFNIRLCDSDGYVAEIEQILGLDLRCDNRRQVEGFS